MKKLFSIIIVAVVFLTMSACSEKTEAQERPMDTASLWSVKSFTLEEDETVCLYDYLIDGVAADLVSGDKTIAEVRGINLKGLKKGSLYITATAPQGTESIDVFVKAKGEMNAGFTLDKAHFRNKKVVFFGDSITARWGINTSDKDYVDLMEEEWLIKPSVFAKGGGTYTLKREIDCYQQIIAGEAKVAGSDYIFMWFGTNDFGGQLSIGNDDDRASTPLRAETFKSSIRGSVEQIREIKPDARIILMTPIYRTNPFNTNNLSKYVDAIIRMGELLDCKVIDLFPLITADDWRLYLQTDGLHVAPAGYRFIADAIMGMPEA